MNDAPLPDMTASRANTADPMIRVRRLHKSFGDKVVLEALDLDVRRGESLVVIGGSGTGKSVLIKDIIGIMKPDSGSIVIDGTETVGPVRPRARGGAGQVRHVVPGLGAVSIR